MIPFKTGFQARYSIPNYQRLFLDRLEERPPPLAPEVQKNTQKLNNLAEGAGKHLLKVKTAIPLNPFPTEIIVDTTKVNIIVREFFFSKNIHSILLRDISDIVVETGPFFATLRIIDIGFTENSIDVGYLRTKDAIKARDIIQGLVVAHKSGVDLSKVQDEGLARKIEDIGSIESPG